MFTDEEIIKLIKENYPIVIDELRNLTKREREVLWLLYYFNPKFTLREIGKHLGVSGERIRQIKCKAIHKIRWRLKGRRWYV